MISEEGLANSNINYSHNNINNLVNKVELTNEEQKAVTLDEVKQDSQRELVVEKKVKYNKFSYDFIKININNEEEGAQVQ